MLSREQASHGPCLTLPLTLDCQVIEAGANAIVSGSGVFGAKDYAAAIKVGCAAAALPLLSWRALAQCSGSLLTLTPPLELLRSQGIKTSKRPAMAHA